MSNYVLTADAEEDLIRIYRYGSLTFGDRQAKKYFDNFYECFERISEQPYSFEAVNHIKEGCRRCVCGSDSIFYTVENKTVHILAIVGRQDINTIF